MTEWDASNSASCTDYEYTYDADGDLLSSRMAPGDLAQAASPTVVPGSLSGSSGAWDWQGDGQWLPVSFTTLSNLSAGNLFLTLSSSAFDPTLILLPSSAVTVSNGTITWVDWSQGIVTTGSGGAGSDYLLQGVTADSTWYVAATSTVQAQGNFSLTWIDNANPIVPTALTELDYTYYADGSVHTVTDSSNLSSLSGNTATTTYAYDALSRVQSISQSGSGASTKAVNFAYYADSQTETVTSTAGSSQSQVAVGTYTYDDDERLTGLAYTHNGSAIATGGVAIGYGLSYDAAGNITQVVSADGTDNCGLDDANELTSASLTGESYTYDANGNRTGGGYVTGAGNEMLSDGTYDYQYDADGNRVAKYESTTGALDSTATNITIYTWDYENRLTQETSYATYSAYQVGIADASQVVTYTYDYQGNMIRRGLDVGGTTTYTYTVYDGQNPYLQVSDAGGLANAPSSAAISQRYLYGPAVDQVLAVDNGGGNVLWGLADYAGTIRDIVGSNGAEVSNGHVQFDSFGKPTGGTAPLANFLFGLNGMRYDPATADYLTQTVPYDPTTGQRLSHDPLGFGSGTTNFTAWAGNNAVQNADPSGECVANYSAGEAIGPSIANAGHWYSQPPAISASDSGLAYRLGYSAGGNTPISSLALRPRNAPTPHSFSAYDFNRGAANTAVTVATMGVLAMACPPAALAVGLTYLAFGIANSLYDRIEANETASQVIFGTIFDNTGVTGVVAGLTDHDLATWNQLNLTSEQAVLRLWAGWRRSRARE